MRKLVSELVRDCRGVTREGESDLLREGGGGREGDSMFDSE